jgi:hypothetical protein
VKSKKRDNSSFVFEARGSAVGFFKAYSTNSKNMASILYKNNEFLNLFSSFSRSMAVGWTQRLTEFNTRNLQRG